MIFASDLGNPSIIPRFPLHVESVTYNAQGVQINSVESESSPSEQNEAQENAEHKLDGKLILQLNTFNF